MIRWRLDAFGLLVISIFAGLGIVEVGLRLVGPPTDEFFAAHDVFGWFHIPGKQGWFRGPEFRTRVTINSHGLIGPDRGYAKPAGVFRILVLGDSMTAAMQVQPEESFSRVLERTLDGGGSPHRFEVINAGVNAWGTANELLFFEHEGSRYGADLVLLTVCTCNDIADNSYKLRLDFGYPGAVPVFHRTENGVRLEYRPRRPPGEGALATTIEGLKTLLRPLAIYKWSRFAAIQGGPLERGLDALGLTRSYRDMGQQIFAMYRAVYPPELAEALEVTKALMVELQRSVAHHGSRLVVVIATNPEQVHPETWHEARRLFALESEEWDLDIPDRRLAAFLSSAGIDHLLLLPRFREHVRRTGARLHFPRDGHWNAAGHRLAATSIHEFLRASATLPATP